MINKTRLSDFLRLLQDCLIATGAVVLLTILLFAIGSRVLGDAVIALLYLLPIAWSAGRWGLAPGLSAALASALCFDFLFVPPFYTFSVGSLEGWLVLAILLGVAVFVVDQIHSNRIRAREAVFMYELSVSLADKRTQEAAARTVARQIRRLFQADGVAVVYKPAAGAPMTSVRESKDLPPEGAPDRKVPVENAWGLVGEIHIWGGPFGTLPDEDSRILQNFARQAAEALERTRMIEKLEAGIPPAETPKTSVRSRN